MKQPGHDYVVRGRFEMSLGFFLHRLEGSRDSGFRDLWVD